MNPDRAALGHDMETAPPDVPTIVRAMSDGRVLALLDPGAPFPAEWAPGSFWVGVHRTVYVRDTEALRQNYEQARAVAAAASLN